MSPACYVEQCAGLDHFVLFWCAKSVLDVYEMATAIAFMSTGLKLKRKQNMDPAGLACYALRFCGGRDCLSGSAAAAMLSAFAAGTIPEPYWLEYTCVNSAPQKNIRAE